MNINTEDPRPNRESLEQNGIVFKSIPGFEGYFASSLGDVWSQRRNRCFKLKSWVSKNGYPYVGLFLDRKQIKYQVGHFVCLAFHGLAPRHEDGRPYDARHLDGNPKNNAPSNLAWGTRSQNQRDIIWYGGRTVTVAMVRKIRILAREGLLHTEIARMLGLHEKQVRAVISGQCSSYVPNEDGTQFDPLPPRWVETSETDRARFRYDRAMGLTIRQIAENHGTTKDRVFRTIKKARGENRQDSPLAKSNTSDVTVNGGT